MHESERILPKSKIKQQKIARRAAKTNAASSIDRQRGGEKERERWQPDNKRVGQPSSTCNSLCVVFPVDQAAFLCGKLPYKKGQLWASALGEGVAQTVPVIQFGFFMQPRVFLIKCRIMNFTCERGRQREREIGRGEREAFKVLISFSNESEFAVTLCQQLARF